MPDGAGAIGIAVAGSVTSCATKIDNAEESK